MATIEDYLPEGKLDPSKAVGGLDAELTEAQKQQQARERDPTTGQFVSTPEEVNWEQRYKDLEVLNSRQAQDLGTYRQMVDEHIMSPTPTAAVVEESQPITVDDLYDNPDEALRKAVESHPVIQEVRQLKADLAQRDLDENIRIFNSRHPDVATINADPKFRTWIESDPLRIELYQRGNQYDLSAADALFRLYKAENQLGTLTAETEQQQQIAAVTLENSSAVMVQDPAKYSRSEYVEKLTRARQGDLEADGWIKANVAGYREALASGNVRD